MNTLLRTLFALSLMVPIAAPITASAAVGADVILGGDTSAQSTSSEPVHSTPIDENSHTTQGSASLDASSDVSVGRSDISGGTSAALDVRVPSLVSTKADLSAYAEATVASDERVEHVSATEDTVSLEYTERAHLFGIFPVLVTAEATADASGTVTLRYPWYRFLMSTSKSELEASLNQQVGATLNQSQASASGHFDAATAARVLAAMHDTMKARLNADMDANASASATANY